MCAEFAPSPTLSVTVDGSGDRWRLTVAGEIDMHTGDTFRRSLADILAIRPTEVALDLAGVTFLDSTAVNCLIRASKQAAGQGATLAVVESNPLVRRVFGVAGVLGLLTADGAPGRPRGGAASVAPGDGS